MGTLDSLCPLRSTSLLLLLVAFIAFILLQFTDAWDVKESY